MISRALATLAALSLLTAPIAVQAAKPREIELHIEATAQVEPDRALVPFAIKGSGETEEEARADLRKREDELRAELAKSGFESAQITVAGAEGGKDPVTTMASEYEPACAASDAAAAAVEAAEARPVNNSRSKVRAVDPVCPGMVAQVTKTLLVEFKDPTKIEQFMALRGEEAYAYGRLRPIYSQSDPAAAQQKARRNALAKANAEADAYADAMGYRVVRVVRISNARPAMSLNDIIGFFVRMEDRVKRLEPSWFGAIVSESVAIDYVIAPK